MSCWKAASHGVLGEFLHLGVAQNQGARVTRVLVFGSIYQGGHVSIGFLSGHFSPENGKRVMSIGHFLRRLSVRQVLQRRWH